MARKAPNLANKSGSGSSSAKARSTPAIRENLGARHRRETDELFRTRLLTAAMFGAILSPLFGVVDVLAHESWFPEMPLVGFLVLRFGITLWFVSLWVFLQSLRRLPVAAMDWLIFAPPAVALGYMTAVTGDTASPYVAGTTLLIAARTILVPGPAMKHIPVVMFLVLSYPLTCFFFGPSGGDFTVWFGDKETMGYLAANLLPLFAVAGVGLVGSDMIHAMHQRLISARSLGRYKIKKELGRGAMGVVYLAWHRDLGRPCVIKIVNPERDTSGALRRRFEREARETSLLRSPYTVQVFDFGVTQQGQLFYVMEYLDGLSLEDRLEQMGPQEFPRVCRWICYACQSLAEAHTRDLIHRDIKPANLFLSRTADGREVVKVLDFGIARKVNGSGGRRRGKKKLSKAAQELTHSDANLTAVGTVMGTPLYVAPEVLEGGAADHRADQYSLAASAYHLLTGRPVFLAATMEELLWKTIEEAPEPPSMALAPGRVPKELDGVLIRALSKDPEHRYSSMEQFRLALEPFAAAPGASTLAEVTSPITES